MTEPRALQALLRELKRRNVYKVGASYLVAAFVVVQVADLASGAFALPSWFEPLAWVASALGFPIALVLAWAYDLGPDGVRRTGTDDGASLSTGPSTPSALGRWGWLVLIVFALAAGLALRDAGPSDDVDRTIAVLPFAATGGDQGVEFGRGLHDGLLTRLTNVGDLTVKSRTSTLRYEGSGATVPEIAREMQVAWVVEGAVHVAGSQVRVNATLIDARTDRRLWARDYERDITIDDVFDIQSDLARTIARSLEAEISPSEMARIESRPTDDLEAYRLNVQGRASLERRTEAGMRQAVEYFEASLARDPSYALAWTGLADARVLLDRYDYDRTDTLPSLARSAAQRALELDPELAEAHATWAYLLVEYENDAPRAYRELTLATELNPSYAPSFHWLASLHVRRGRPEEALEPMQRAAELDPFSPTIHNVLGLIHWILEGAGPTSIEHVREAQELEPGFTLPYANEALMLSELGRHEEAIAAAEAALERARPEAFDWGYAYGVLAVTLSRSGDEAGANEVLERLRALGGDPFWEAMVLTVMGDEEQAFRELEEVDWTSYLWWDAQGHPVMAPLRDDPRYQEILRSLRERWGLEPDGSFPGS